MAKTQWVQIDAYLDWAKVFSENRDTAERAKKQGVTHKGVLKFLEKFDGQYTVQVTPATGHDLQEVQKFLTEKLYGGKPRFTDSDKGCGKKFELSRRHDDKHTFKDRETGKDVDYDFGGEPEIVWFNDDKGKNVDWDKQKDGLIGNGSLAKVKFSVYMGEDKPSESDTVRLEKLGIIEQVVYESDSTNSGERF